MTPILPSTPCRGLLGLATRVVLLIAAGSLALRAGTDDPAAAIRVGTPLAEVVAALGKPEKSEKVFFGRYEHLFYRNYKISLRGGLVTEVRNLNPPPKPPKPAKAVKPEPQAMVRPVALPREIETEEVQDPEERRPGAAAVAVAPPAPAPKPVPVVVPAPAPVPVPVVVPGPVPPKAAPALQAPVAAPAPPVALPPASGSRPALPPPPPPAVSDLAPAQAMPAPRPTAVPQLGDLPAALAQGVQRVRLVPAEHWTLRLEVASQPDTVRQAPGYFKSEKPDLFVLSVPTPGGTTYHVFLGDFATRQAADRMARQLPSAFGHPAVLKYQKLRTLVAASR